MKVYDSLDLDSPKAIIGRHSVWLPDLEIKVPFQFGGRICKYGHREESTPVEQTLPHEIAILKALAAERMAPPIGDLVYFKHITHTGHLGAWHCDPMGAYGYEMIDADRVQTGTFSRAAMKALPIQGSPNAWGDVVKPGNVVNGHLVDVRRSAWDMLKWTGDLPMLETYTEDQDALRERVNRLCSFPKGERPEAYQDYLLGAEWVRGSRRVGSRARELGFGPRSGESVLDIGCQSGGFLQFASLRFASPCRLAGIDIDRDYIACARDLARANGENICYRVDDVRRHVRATISWARRYFRPQLSHLILCSLEKHIGEETIWRLVDEIGARHTYIETNAQRAGDYVLREGVEARGGCYIGDSDDRNVRRLFRIDR